MIRLRALNEESSEESEGEDEIPAFTKEAQEQAAFSEYNKALKLIQEKKLEGAQEILEELLNSDFLAEVSKHNVPEGFVQPGLALKYSCLKNLGSIQNELKNYKCALDNYLKAASLDDTDVTLWHQIGTLAIKVLDYELACDAFLEGLHSSPCHWPSLENVVMVLYVLNDYIGCLLYIARCLELDPDFLIGLAFRDQILHEQPSIAEEFEMYCKGQSLGSLNEEYDHEIGEQQVEIAKNMREARHHQTQEALFPKPVPLITVNLKSYSWLALGEAILGYYNKAERFCAPVKLVLVTPGSEEQKEFLVDMQVTEPGLSVDAAEENLDIDGEDEDMTSEQQQQQQGSQSEGEDPKSRKRKRSQMAFMEHWMWGGKRRSARVRSTIKREAEREDGNIEEALRRLVPSALLPSNMKENNQKTVDNNAINDDSMDTMDLYKLFERRESVEGPSEERNISQNKPFSKLKEVLSKTVEQEGYFGSISEEQDVESFVTSCKSCDVIELLLQYITVLSKKWKLTWPSEMLLLYVETYKILRKHVQHPSIFVQDENSDIEADASSTVFYLELYLDQFSNNKSSSAIQLLNEQSVATEDIGHLIFLSLHRDLFGSQYLEYAMRILWLKAHLFLQQGNVDVAIQSLDTLLCHMETAGEEEQKTRIILPNCQHHNIITKDAATKLLTTLIRNQSLCEVQQLYEEKKFEQLTEILQETFRYQQPGSGSGSPENCPDRATQLAMLMDALWHLKKYQECFYWGEACCNEAFQKYLASEDKEQQKWASTIEKLLAGLESCVSKAGLSVVDSPRLPRLVQNLMHMLCHQLEAPDTAVEMPIETVTPWILLQQIIQWEEEKNKDIEKQKAVEGERLLPNHLSFLFTAHEHLAKRSWCCSNEGALLLHTMDVVVPRIHSTELAPLRDQLVPLMEQVFYCLYAHPSKKTKARYLQDHGVPQITLTWERAIQLFQFYKPVQLPEFDSYRVVSITAEVETLLKRIIQLVPPQSDPVLQVDRMSQYIEGQLKEIPCPPSTYVHLSPKVASIYYLLGDFYFKNNEWPKAIRHYLLDVCVNPVRLDSWAGMALARGSQLETRLNSCEHLKSETEFLRHAEAAYRCFTRSLEIDRSHSLLWIEKGNFVYMVHSFCSRLLKQETDSLSLEKFTILEEQKERMLDIADNCFNSALKVWNTLGPAGMVHDERWLLHYMLGKVAEKRDLEPEVFLEHYAKSSKFLDLLGANYARKITYNNPQNLAVEALEVFYRIHASILKHLEQNEGRILDESKKILFEQRLQEAANGPFMAAQCEMKSENEDDRRKRPADFQADDVLYRSKRRCMDENLDLSVMEDVINLMEDMISKVADDKAYIPEEPLEAESIISKQQLLRTNNKLKHAMEVVVISDDSIDSDDENINNTVLPSNKQDIVKNNPDENCPIKNISESLKTESADQSDNDDDKQISSQDIDFENKLLSRTGNVQPETVSKKETDGATPISENTVSSKKENGAELSEEPTVVRRSSQESTTTTTSTTTRTETSTSAVDSSNDSDDSSSSDHEDDSTSSTTSDTSGSSASDSEDLNQSTSTVVEKKCGSPRTAQNAIKSERRTEDGKCDHFSLVKKCLVALEECVLRFPHHYKSLYRLTHYYFHSKFHRDINKCQDLLLGTYKCLEAPGRPSGCTVQGLFADRKSNNFFNGVWRIPVPEIDRPGCFASHMSRCVLLLMDVLRELRNHLLLLELCVALRRTPEPDKKYLRDSERELLSRQALSLALQTLRAKLRDEIHTGLLLDVYRTYQYVQKHLPQKEGTFSTILKDICRRYKKEENCTLEQAIRICQQESVTVNSTPTPAVQSTPVAQVQNRQMPVKTSPSTSLLAAKKPPVQPVAVPSSVVSPKPSATVTATRPRGRPPGSSRCPSQTTAPPVSSQYSGLSTVLNDPTALINMMMQTQMTEYQAEFFRKLAANSVGAVLNPMMGLGTTAVRDRPNVSILPITQPSTPLSKSNVKLATVQQKVSSSSPSYPKSTSQVTSASAPQPNLLTSPKSSTKLTSYPVLQDPKFSNQIPVDHTTRKYAEGITQEPYQHQVPARKNVNKPLTTMITYKQDINTVNKIPNHQKEKINLSPYKSTKLSSPTASGKNAYKLLSGDVKDNSVYPRGQLNSINRNSPVRGNTRHQINSNPSRNLLHDISAAQSSGISMLNRLQQQSNQLEVIHKPKNSSLELPPSVSIPSSITITPKKSGRSSVPDSKNMKKLKDTVSILEIGTAAQRNKNVPQSALPKSWPPAASPVKEKDNEVDSDVEIITLE